MEEIDMEVTETTEHSDEKRYLPNADVSEDFELSLFLKDIAQNLDKTAYETIKFIVKCEISSGEKRLENWNGPLDIFSYLMKYEKISNCNLLYLQSLIWHTQRKDLMRKFVEFSQENDKKPLHFFMPSDEPANGYKHVNVHIRGNICNLTNEKKEKQRHQLSKLLRIPLELVLLVGIQPSNSILLTFMVPEISIEIFKSLKPTIEGISVEFVEDVLTIRDIPLENKEPKDEKTELEKEVKHWREKEKRMKQELDLTLTQLLETEEELHLLKEQIPLQDEQSVDKKIHLEKQEGKDEITELVKQKEDLEIEEKIPLEKQEGKDEITELGKQKEDLEIEEKIPLEKQKEKNEITELGKQKEDLEIEENIHLENKEPKDEKTQLEKEVKYLMEKVKKMKQELDLTLTQLLETEEELHALKKQISLQAEESVHKEIPVEKQERKDEKTELGKQKEDLEIEEKIPLEKQERKDENTELGKHLQDLQIEESIPSAYYLRKDEIIDLIKHLKDSEMTRSNLQTLVLTPIELIIHMERSRKRRRSLLEKKVPMQLEESMITTLLQIENEVLTQLEESRMRMVLEMDRKLTELEELSMIRMLTMEKKELTQLEESQMRTMLELEKMLYQLEESRRRKMLEKEENVLTQLGESRMRTMLEKEEKLHRAKKGLKEDPVDSEMRRKHVKDPWLQHREMLEKEEKISKGKQEPRHEKRWKTL